MKGKGVRWGGESKGEEGIGRKIEDLEGGKRRSREGKKTEGVEGKRRMEVGKVNFSRQ